MLKQRYGRIVNVSSLAGRVGFPSNKKEGAKSALDYESS